MVNIIEFQKVAEVIGDWYFERGAAKEIDCAFTLKKKRLTAPILVIQLVTTLYNLIRLDSEGGSCVFHNTTPQYSSTSGKKKELIHNASLIIGIEDALGVWQMIMLTSDHNKKMLQCKCNSLQNQHIR